MKERLIQGLRTIAHVEHLETPEQAKQSRIEYLDYLESQLSIPSDIRDGYLRDRLILGGFINFTNWRWKADFVHKDEQTQTFNEIYGTSLDWVVSPNTCYRYADIPVDKDLVLFDKINIPLRRKKAVTPANEIPMESEIFYTLEKEENDIQ